MDYDIGFGEFGIPIEFTIFIPITAINENNGGTQIWPDIDLGKRIDVESFEKSKNSIVITEDIGNVYAISASTHHRGLKNESKVVRDVIAIRLSSGIPCANVNEPCHIGKHQLTFGVSARNRDRSSKLALQNLDMMLPDQQAFILEVRSAVSFKRHRAMHLEKERKPVIDDYLLTCKYCAVHKVTKRSHLKRHEETCGKNPEKFRVSEEELICYYKKENKVCNKKFLSNKSLKRHITELHNHKSSTGVCGIMRNVNGISQPCAYTSQRPSNFIRHQKSFHNK